MQQLVADLESKAVLLAKISQKYLSDVTNGNNDRINLTETSGKWRFLKLKYPIYNFIPYQAR